MKTQEARPGDPATRRPATRRPGDPATRRPGDPATRRPGDPATRRPGDPATRRPGDPATHYTAALSTGCQAASRARAVTPTHGAEHRPQPTLHRPTAEQTAIHDALLCRSIALAALLPVPQTVLVNNRNADAAERASCPPASYRARYRALYAPVRAKPPRRTSKTCRLSIVVDRPAAAVHGRAPRRREVEPDRKPGGGRVSGGGRSPPLIITGEMEATP